MMTQKFLGEYTRMLGGSNQQKQNIDLAQPFIAALRRPQSSEQIIKALAEIIAILDNMSNFESNIKKLYQSLKRQEKIEEENDEKTEKENKKGEEKEAAQSEAEIIRDSILRFEFANQSNGLQIAFNQLSVKYNLMSLSNIRKLAKKVTHSSLDLRTTERLYQIFGLLHVYTNKMKELHAQIFPSESLDAVLKALAIKDFHPDAIQAFLEANKNEYKYPSEENEIIKSDIFRLEDEVRMLRKRLQNHEKALITYDTPILGDNLVENIKKQLTREEIEDSIREIKILIVKREEEIPNQILALKEKITENEKRIAAWGNDRILLADYFANILTLENDFAVLFHADANKFVESLDMIFASAKLFFEEDNNERKKSDEKEEWDEGFELTDEASLEMELTTHTKSTPNILLAAEEDSDWNKDLNVESPSFPSNTKRTTTATLSMEEGEDEDWAKEFGTEPLKPLKLVLSKKPAIVKDKGSDSIKTTSLLRIDSANEDGNSGSEEEDWNAEFGLAEQFQTMQIESQKSYGLTPSFEASKAKKLPKAKDSKDDVEEMVLEDMNEGNLFPNAKRNQTPNSSNLFG